MTQSESMARPTKPPPPVPVASLFHLPSLPPAPPPPRHHLPISPSTPAISAVPHPPSVTHRVDLLAGECPNCGTKGIPQEFFTLHIERHCFARLHIAPVIKEVHHIHYGVALANFRDLGGWEAFLRDKDNTVLRQGRIRKGLIFRSSSINRATDQDTRIIVHQLKIKSLLDLRTAEYAGKRGPFLSRYFRVLQRSGDGWVVPRSEKKKASTRDAQADMAVRANASAQRLMQLDRESENWSDDTASYDWLAEEMSSEAIIDHGRLFPVGLVGSDFKRELLLQTPKRNLVKAGVKYLRGAGASEYREAVVGAIFNQPDGLETLYRLFVDSCQKEVYGFFMTLLAHAELPAVIYCNHGKDRTGFLCALILSICGVDQDIIFDNYALSDEFLRPIAIHVESEMTDGGLVPAIMARSPRDVIKTTFQYIEHKYGSIQNYLGHIGFGPPLQELLFYRLVEFDQTALKDSAGSDRSGRRRGTTIITQGELSNLFPTRPTSASMSANQIVWELPLALPHDSELLIAPASEPLVYFGTLTQPGSYELFVLLKDVGPEFFVTVQFSFNAISQSTPSKVKSTIQPPFVLSQHSTLALLRPFSVKSNNLRIDWRLVITGCPSPVKIVSNISFERSL